MQPGDSSNTERGERSERNVGVDETPISLTEFPTIISIESEEYSNLSSFDPIPTRARNKVTPAEVFKSSVGNRSISHCEDTKDIVIGSKHLPAEEPQREFSKGPAAPVSVTKPLSSCPMFTEEEGTEIPSLSTEDKNNVHVDMDKEPELHDSKTLMGQRPQEVNEVTGITEKAKPKKVKTLSFIEDPSPKGVEDACARFGTPTNEYQSDLSKISASAVRVRGRTSKRANGKSKRSQTPAAPPINMADYGSDDDIAADLVEIAYVQAESSGRNNTTTPGSRNTKPNEARSILNARERSAKHDKSAQKPHGHTQSNAERGPVRARVSFELPESANAKAAGKVPKPKCHTPFPRDTIDLLAGSDSEDSDGIPSECLARVSLSTATTKSTKSVQTSDPSLMESHRSMQNATPFWMSDSKEARGSGNVQNPCPSKKMSFTTRSVRTSSNKTTVLSRTQPAQHISFIRIGGPRNKLTFERGAETLNIPPSSPSLQRPQLVPGSFCCTCGQNVSHL